MLPLICANLLQAMIMTVHIEINVIRLENPKNKNKITCYDSVFFFFSQTKVTTFVSIFNKIDLLVANAIYINPHNYSNKKKMNLKDG